MFFYFTEYFLQKFTQNFRSVISSVAQELVNLNFKIYPLVYRALQRNPDLALLQLAASDFISLPSQEKVDILYFAVENLKEDFDAEIGGILVNVANRVIPKDCSFYSDVPSSVFEYFEETPGAALSEAEIFSVLNMLNKVKGRA